MNFPVTRMRRLRSSSNLRKMLMEHHVYASDMVLPIFIKEGLKQKKEIKSMPKQFQHTIRSALALASQAYDAGIPAVILFGIPAHKDREGSGAFDPEGVCLLYTS